MKDQVKAEHTHHTKQLRTILIVLGLVVLAAAAGGGLRWWQLDQAAKEAATPTATERKAYDAQDKALAGDPGAAHDQLESALDNKYLSTDERYTLTSQQATVYENEKKYAEALKAYQAADTIKPTRDVAESIARVAEAMGSKDLAIASYKRAITRIVDNYPLAGEDKLRYEDHIRSLGGQP